MSACEPNLDSSTDSAARPYEDSLTLSYGRQRQTLKHMVRGYRRAMACALAFCILLLAYVATYLILRGPEQLYLIDVGGYRLGPCPAIEQFRRFGPLFIPAAAMELSWRANVRFVWACRVVQREYEILERGERESAFRTEMNLPPMNQVYTLVVLPGSNWINPQIRAKQLCFQKFGPWPEALSYP